MQGDAAFRAEEINADKLANFLDTVDRTVGTGFIVDPDGPLFDLRGDVIGMNTAVILPQKQTNGIGFAIPMGERFKQIIQDLKEGREVVYGYLGVKSTSPTARERKASGIDDEIGAF